MKESEKNRLHSSSLFQAFSTKELDEISQFFECINFMSDKNIITQGQPVEGLYLMREGAAEATVCLPGDRQSKLTTLKEGNFFGEIVLIKGGVAAATIKAIEPTACYFLSHQAFLGLRALFPTLGLKLIVGITFQICKCIMLSISKISGVLNDIKNPSQLIQHQNIDISDVYISTAQLSKENIRLRLLKDLSAFKNYTDKELETLLSYFKLVKVKKHTLISTEEGNLDENTYVIIQGAVGTTVRNAENSNITKLGVLGLGHLFTRNYHPCAIEQKAALSITYATREPTIMFVLEPRQLKKLYDENIKLYCKWQLSISISLARLQESINTQLIRYQSELLIPS